MISCAFYFSFDISLLFSSGVVCSVFLHSCVPSGLDILSRGFILVLIIVLDLTSEVLFFIYFKVLDSVLSFIYF